MYPQRELSRLALHKVSLRRKIGLRRASCQRAVERLSRPLDWFDRVVAFAARLAPLTQLAAWPLGLLLQRVVSPRLKFLGPVLRWAPHILGALRGLAARTKA